MVDRILLAWQESGGYGGSAVSTDAKKVHEALMIVLTGRDQKEIQFGEDSEHSVCFAKLVFKLNDGKDIVDVQILLDRSGGRGQSFKKMMDHLEKAMIDHFQDKLHILFGS